MEGEPHMWSLPEPLATADQLVKSRFKVLNLWPSLSSLTYEVGLEPDMKRRFLDLNFKLIPMGLTPILRREGGQVILRVLPAMVKRKRQWTRLSKLLFLATIATVSLAGFTFTLSPVLQELMPNMNPWLVVPTYTLALLLIVGLHELGHKIACLYHGIKSTPPLFIPAPPIPPFFPIGTFGAVILQESPPVNRDQLFDLGLLGPLVGFITAVLISAIGIQLSVLVPSALIARLPEPPTELPVSPVFMLLIGWLMPEAGEDYVPLLHPVGFAGWVGTIITLLNAIPIGQLDGGHVLRAVTGRRLHSAISMVATLFMAIFISPVMAIFGLMTALRGHPGPLDDVSPLSPSRKALFPLLFIICGLCFIRMSLF
ncbi:MAG: site-2 protease family protein [Candidatus Nezhaarchaeales archaeon]